MPTLSRIVYLPELPTGVAKVAEPLPVESVRTLGGALNLVLCRPLLDLVEALFRRASNQPSQPKSVDDLLSDESGGDFYGAVPMIKGFDLSLDLSRRLDHVFDDVGDLESSQVPGTVVLTPLVVAGELVISLSIKSPALLYKVQEYQERRILGERHTQTYRLGT